MALRIGDILPDGIFESFRAGNLERLSTADVFEGRRVAVFAMLGAFTGDCSGIHLPSVVAVAPALAAKGVDEVAILCVNDPFVMRAWGDAMGAGNAGIRLLSDSSGAFTRAVGMEISIPPIGLIGRSRRYSMLAEDRTVRLLNVEPGADIVCSKGETLLDQI